MTDKNAEEVSVQDRLSQIASSIQGNTQWTGQTNRELRDKVEGLTKQIGETTEGTIRELSGLTQAIIRQSESSEKLSRWMVVFTFVLAIATLIMAAVAMIDLFK